MISEKSLIEFFKITPTPSLVLLPDGPKFTIVEVNLASLAATNSMREDLIGKGIFETFPDNASDPTAESLKNLTQSLNTVIKTKKSHKMALQKYTIPIRGTSKYKLKYRNSENRPLLNNGGDIKTIIHSFTNVTEKKVIDENSNESKISEKLSTKILLQTEKIAKIGRWERDFVTGKMHWSDNLYLLLGYQPQEFEITMDKIFEFIHPDDIERRNTLFEHAQKNQEDFNRNVRFVAQDKSIVYITIRGVFIFDNNGKPKKTVGTIQDTTDITTAEFNALESKRAIQKILDLSLDIICTGDELGNFLTTNAACELILCYTPEEFIVKNFTEFVYKVISNSLKYSKSDSAPVINITSEETALAWKFVIRDNGIGINPEYFDKIFIIFQRLHNKDEYSGTGMGLAVTKKNIDNLGGQIWLESEEEVGTAFHFTILKKQTKRL